MPIVKLARFEVRADAREVAERAMHELATYVRNELPDSTWTAYRDPRAPARFIAVIMAKTPAADETYRKASGTLAFLAALEPVLVGKLEITDCELVTSSDLQRRQPGGRRPR